MTLAIFDLDNTLIAGDSDHLWGEYMIANGIVDENAFRQKNDLFYEDYKGGRLDNDVYLKFALEPLTNYSIEELYRWRQDFVETWIKPIIAPGAADILEKHRSQQHQLLIISATHLFITQPIAAVLGVPTVLSTEPEIVDNRYTGRFLGTATYKEGKVTALQEWLLKSGHNLEGSYFYSDSITDITLLERVDNPIAVNPEENLNSIAIQRDWKILDLR
jgi:HAD superfamily hydrolase (TIGR01490 family)